MRPPFLALAAVLSMPAAALAEPLDLGDDAAPALETDNPTTDAGKLGDLEDQVDTKALALEPKLDLTDDQPEILKDSIPLDHTDQEPAPGFRLKIPN